MKPTELTLYRPPSLQAALPLGALTISGLDEKARREVVAVLARLLLEAAGAGARREVDDDGP